MTFRRIILNLTSQLTCKRGTVYVKINFVKSLPDKLETGNLERNPVPSENAIITHLGYLPNLYLNYFSWQLEHAYHEVLYNSLEHYNLTYLGDYVFHGDSYKK